MVRVVLLLLVGLSVWAQELEEFTLTDGRVIVGNYDPATKRMQVHVGKGVVGIAIEPGKIVSRRPFTSPPVAVVEPQLTPPSPPEVKEPDNRVVDITVPKDQYVYGDDEKHREIEIWNATEGMPVALSERFKRLNPCSPAMLRAKARKDFPIRYRCLIALSDPVPPRLEFIARYKWVLAAYDDAGACFGFFLVDRDSEEGKRVEKMLQKEKFAALHAWIDRRPGSDEEFIVDRIIADHWNPKMDGK